MHVGSKIAELFHSQINCNLSGFILHPLKLHNPSNTIVQVVRDEAQTLNFDLCDYVVSVCNAVSIPLLLLHKIPP